MAGEIGLMLSIAVWVSNEWCGRFAWKVVSYGGSLSLIWLRNWDVKRPWNFSFTRAIVSFDV